MTPSCSIEDLDEILEHQRLSAIFQPIVDVSARRIKGYEALIRGPSDSPLHSPLMLFDAASRMGRLQPLELLCREICIRQFQYLNLPGKLFLNVVPETMLDTSGHSSLTLSLLERYGIAPDRVVIELTEHFPLDDYSVMRQCTYHYKSLGFEIAIDDLGAGYAGLRMWSELEPDYVKIDRHFIQDIHEDLVKREFVRSIFDISRSLNCEVIAEGLETEEECAILCELGITQLQGYLFARPRAIPVHEFSLLNYHCVEMRKSNDINVHLTDSIGAIAMRVPVVAPDTRIEEVGKMFRNNPTQLSLPVVDGDHAPLGIVRRNMLMDILSTQFGLSLHGRKPVSMIMDREAVMVDKTTSVEEVSKRITARGQTGIENDFIVTEKGCYSGVGSVLDLLRKITDLQIRNARYANPLTLLPGNVPIYELVDRLLAKQESFLIAYCDVDNFKPFNDAYGYSKGDQVLISVANIISESIDAERDFIGHIGGDDFVIILKSDDWEQRCRNILECFEAKVPSFYSQEHREQGGLVAINRRGEELFMPFLSLSIGVASPDFSRCHSHHDVAALATGAKREAKTQPGNHLYIDRRQA